MDDISENDQDNDVSEVHRKTQQEVQGWVNDLPDFKPEKPFPDPEKPFPDPENSFIEPENPSTEVENPLPAELPPADIETSTNREIASPVDEKEKYSGTRASSANNGKDKAKDKHFPAAIEMSAPRIEPEALSVDEDDPSDVADDTRNLPNIVEYEKFVKNSSSYQWLLSMIKRLCELKLPGQVDAMAGIRGSISELVFSEPALRRVSRQTTPPFVEVSVSVDWDLRAFIRDQEYATRPDQVLDRAICLIGTWGEAHAMAPAAYLKQTWPLVYEPFYDLMKRFLSSGAGAHECK